MKTAPQRKMKPSGVDWIGDVPEGWGVVPIKYLTSCNDEVLPENTDSYYEFDYVEIGDVKYESGIGSVERIIFGDAPSRARRVVRAGDVIISTVRTYLKAVASIEEFEFPLIVSTGFAVLRAADVYYRYLYYAMLSQDFQSQVTLYSKGVSYPAITSNSLLHIPIRVPPLDEQKRIAAKLDRLCGRVDELAENIKGEIAALQEYRKSLIIECVTKGLNPKAKMKPSGVDWIGGVPEGWGIDKFCYRFDFAKGLNITKQDLTETGVPVVSYGQIHSKRNDGVHLTDELLRHIPAELTKGEYAARLKRNDFVFADTSEDVEGIGNCVTVNRDEVIYAGYHTLVARPIEKVNCGYFGYLFKSECWRQQLRRKANSVKVYSISQRLFKGVSILLPPLDEQSRIAAFLDKRCAVIDAKIAERQRQLEKLGEYRSSVIYEYVTGKKEASA